MWALGATRPSEGALVPCAVEDVLTISRAHAFPVLIPGPEVRERSVFGGAFDIRPLASSSFFDKACQSHHLNDDASSQGFVTHTEEGRTFNPMGTVRRSRRSYFRSMGRGDRTLNTRTKQRKLSCHRSFCRGGRTVLNAIHAGRQFKMRLPCLAGRANNLDREKEKVEKLMK